MSARVFECRTESHAGKSLPSFRLKLSVDEPESSLSADTRKGTDEELVTMAKSGDQPAFVELCRRYGRVLTRRIRRMVQNHHDAEDILQDSILRAYTNLDGFRGCCSFQTWITTIAINSSLMHLRKRRRLHSHASMELPTTDGERGRSWDIPDPSPNPEHYYATYQTSAMLARAVERLPKKSRELLEHYHKDEGKMVDVANAIGITVAAAKSRLLRARRLLRHCLEND